MRQVARRWGCKERAISLVRYFHFTQRLLPSGGKSIANDRGDIVPRKKDAIMSTLSRSESPRIQGQKEDITAEELRVEHDATSDLSIPTQLTEFEAQLAKKKAELLTLLTEMKAELTMGKKKRDIEMRIFMGETVPETPLTQQAEMDAELTKEKAEQLTEMDAELMKEKAELLTQLTDIKAELTIANKQLDIVMRISIGETVPETPFVQFFKRKGPEEQATFIDKLKGKIYCHNRTTKNIELAAERVHERVKFLTLLRSVGTQQQGCRTVHRLTAHPTEMCGEERLKAVRRIVGGTVNRDVRLIVCNPVWCVIAAPHQGKSRLLDEVAEKFYELSQQKPKDKRDIVVSITFDSDSALTQPDADSISRKPSLAIAHFWGRVVHRLLWATDKDKYKFEFVKEQSWFPFVNEAWADDAARELGHTGNYGRWIIMADELSKLLKAVSAPIVGHNDKAARERVLSHFRSVSVENGALVASGVEDDFPSAFATLSFSGRPAYRVKLVPTIFKNRHEFKRMFDAVEKELKDRGAPFAWMTLELLKYSPGLVGLWLETLKDSPNHPVSTLSELMPPIVGRLSAEGTIDEFISAVDNQLRHCATAALDKTLTLAGNGDAESLGIFLNADNHCNSANNYFLNPFFLFHEKLKYDFPGKTGIVASLGDWEKAKLDHTILVKWEMWGELSPFDFEEVKSAIKRLTKEQPTLSQTIERITAEQPNLNLTLECIRKEQPTFNLKELIEAAGSILNKAKGNVAKEIVASALAVRLVHTPTTTLADLIKRIGGAPYHSPAFPLDDESSRAVADGEFLASKETAFVKLIDFPCGNQSPHERASKEEIFKLNVEAINGIRGASVLRMTDEFDAGCDLGIILNTERKDNKKGGAVKEKALFLYEVRHHAPLWESHTNHPLEIVKKAQFVLNGLVHNTNCDSKGKENYLQQCGITRVVFVYCVTNTSVEYNTECRLKLQSLVKRFNEKNKDHRCNASVHIIDEGEKRDNDRLWKELLMNTFYYIFPDPDINLIRDARTT